MRKVIPIAVAVAVGALLLVWWLRRPSDKPATQKPGSAAVAQAKRAAPKPPPKPASISGKVTRKQDGGAVANAVVSLARAELGASFSQTTSPTIIVTSNDAGAWEANEVPPGDYMIAASARGLLPSTHAKITIQAGEQRTIDFALEAGGISVKGTVTDVGGGPIASARVTAKRNAWTLSAGAEYVALTGADGTYELALPDGQYRMSAEHDDYAPGRKQLELAGKPQTIDFTLIPGGVIRGQVIARDTREPVPNALISARGGGRGRGGWRDATAVADQGGKFVLRGLGSGSTSITARGRGYASQQPTMVQLGIGEEVEDIQVLVDGAYSIIGRVVKKGTQTGVAGARLGAFSMAGGGGEAIEPTDETGDFEIPGLRPGSYMLFAAAEKMLIEIGGKTIEIKDADATGVVVELTTGAVLSGRVEPPQVATVTLELEGEVGLANMFDMVKAMMARTESDATGAFTLANAPPGKFVLGARSKDGNGGKLSVVVAAVDQTGLVVQLTKKASIAGRVVDTKGKPVSGIHVSANPEDTKGIKFSMNMISQPEAMSGTDGTFKIVGLEAGKYEVGVRDFESMMARARDKDRKKNLVEVSAGADKTGVTVTVEARDGVIRGVVIGADGKPAADAWVSARREREDKDLKLEEFEASGGGGGRWSGGGSDPVLTGADGRFTIDKLRNGKYTLIADGPRGSSRGEKKGVNVGDSATINLAALGTLVVTVAQKGGAPVKEYDLSCDSQAHDVDRHAASEDGSYKLENLAPAEYKCKITADIGTAEGKVTVPSGETKLALVLSPYATLTGTVVSVLGGKGVPDLNVIVQSDGGKGFFEAMTGQGPKTNADGKFVVERVRAGKGKVSFVGRMGSFGDMDPHEYTAGEGERVDMGTIRIVPPRNTEAGTYGFATEVDGNLLKVTDVTAGGPAAGAGIVVDDKIISIEGIPLEALKPDIAKKLLSSGVVGVGQTVKLGLEKGTVVSVTSIKW